MVVLSSKNKKIVADIPKRIMDNLNINSQSASVELTERAIRHIKDGHYEDYMKYGHRISEIIGSPDYYGSNDKYANTIELYKKFDDNVLLAIKVNKKSTFSISTMFVLKNGDNKIAGRLKSGRIKKF